MNYCMYDRDEQCFEDCPKCSRAKTHFECCNCGRRDDLYATDSGVYCESCLSDLINKSENKALRNDILSEFLLHYHEEFENFIKEWFSDSKVVGEC